MIFFLNLRTWSLRNAVRNQQLSNSVEEENTIRIRVRDKLLDI